MDGRLPIANCPPIIVYRISSISYQRSLSVLASFPLYSARRNRLRGVEKWMFR